MSQQVIRLSDLDTDFRFDPADPVASIRTAEAADLGERVARIAAIVRAMAAAGVMDAVTEATVKDYVTRNKLLGAGAFDRIVREATTRARREPRRSEPPKTAQEPSTGDPLPDEPDSELGYARRLVHVYGDRVRYVPEWKWWLIWDGRRWARDATGQAPRWMKSIARRVTSDALAIEDEKERQAALNRARRGESSAGVSGALTLAGTETEVVVTPDDLDADPFLLNCTNGTLDLRTGELRPHDPADLITKMTTAAYDPSAAGAQFGAFLERVQPDQAMREFLARLLGHSLEGRVSDILPIFHGEGANGKSTLIGVVLAALGDYADAADPELLTARTFDAHPTGVADLCGLRLAVLHEIDRGRRLAEGTVKRLTGGDRLKARRMRENFWSFDPSHTFVMLTNHKPIVAGTDEAIWRRLRLVPWDVVIPAAERDKELPARLRLESDAVLAWLVAGYADWHENGMGEPAQVTAATSAFKAESDVLGRFISDTCLTAPGMSVRSSELFTAWCKWCADQAEEPGTQTAFSLSLTNRGFDKKATSVGNFWQGLGLASD